MIATRFMELRKRRGLMIALILVTIGIPTVFLVIRLLLHAFAPHSYGPAGGYDIFTGLVAGVLYVFGFIVAATLGATAGSADLTEGMFRHLVVTGRSRLALYLARIPAGLAIIVPLVAVGFTIVCAVCVFAAPTRLSFNGVNVPANLSQRRPRELGRRPPGRGHLQLRLQDRTVFPDIWDRRVVNSVPCGNGPGGGPAIVKQPPGSQGQPQPSQAQIRQAASLIARMNYSDYARQFLYPSNSLMIKSGLWLELEAVIGFVVGLGLGSLIGQRTVAVILMIVLEVVLTPILSRARHPPSVEPAAGGGRPGHGPPGTGRAPGARRRRWGARRAAGGIPDCCRSRRPWPSASSSPGWWAGQSSARGE